ncbi:hypothetical protein ABW20_dc0105844 [Dactylellina cionopaga]|nr:hypothetical protein ABW20_dc0105844 [Dactylellina cionopaga]
MSIINEKRTVILEDLPTERIDLSDNNSEYIEYSEAEKKRIMRRIDLRLVPVVSLLSCISFIDKANLGSASIAGMNTELGMNAKNNGYAMAALILTITYVLCQPPAMILCRKIGPRIFLAIVAFLWGIVLIGMGFTKRWQQIVGLRVILGAFEAGYYPAMVYLLSTWYTRYELGKRFAAFYCIECTVTVFFSFGVYGLIKMNGIAGLSGWRWIFVMEGIITCVLAAIGYLLMVPFPDDKDAHTSWKFLNRSEVNYIIRKINADRDDAHTEPFSWRQYFNAAKDVKLHLMGFGLGLCGVATTPLVYFVPTILTKGMGFSIMQAQFLGSVPTITLGIWMVLCGWFSDKYKIRGPVVIFNNLLEIVGVLMLGWSSNNAVRYTGTFFILAGSFTNLPLVFTYQANNIRGQWKRSFASMNTISWGAVGGIIGTLMFRSVNSLRLDV